MSTNNEKLCERFDDEIWLYLDGELAKTEMASWENHLKKCASCQKRLLEIKSVELAYKNVPAVKFDAKQLQKQISRAENTVASTRRYQPPVPPIFKVLGGILLPIAAAVMFYLRLHPVETEQNYNWEPINFQQTITEIDSSLNALSSDLLWAETGESAWDEMRMDLEYRIEDISEALKE